MLDGNAFQRARLGAARELAALPLTTKEELLADQAAHPPFGTNLTFGLERYTHLHQTSGSTGTTLRVLDTAEDWAWWRAQLGRVLRATGIGAGDRVALAHSFGPYVQFWASYEGAQEAGALVIPLGGMDSVQRLETMREYGATALLCTPSYALHLAKVAAEKDLGTALDAVERVVCTGEPGASLPAVRDRIESAWGRAASTTRARPRSARSPIRARATAACICSRTSTSAKSSIPRPGRRRPKARRASW